MQKANITNLYDLVYSKNTHEHAVELSSRFVKNQFPLQLVDSTNQTSRCLSNPIFPSYDILDKEKNKNNYYLLFVDSSALCASILYIFIFSYVFIH